MTKIDQQKRRKVLNTANFIEELVWLLDSKRGGDLRDIPVILRSILEDEYSDINVSQKLVPTNPNQSYLIGVLPNLFQDVDLFKTNFDLVEFAETVLHIPINRPEKRSRYELIGLIVCEVTNLNENDLSQLVAALSTVSNSKDQLRKIKEARKQANFSWNETINLLNSL